MTNNTNFNWAEDIDAAVTVCDKEGKVLYMNQRSRNTFSKDGSSMVGQNLMHCYTISKNGLRKLIFQTPWRKDGNVEGLVEISIVLPDEMPHYDRG